MLRIMNCTIMILLAVAFSKPLHADNCNFLGFGKDAANDPISTGPWFTSGPVWTPHMPGGILPSTPPKDTVTFDAGLIGPPYPGNGFGIYLGDYWQLDTFSQSWACYGGNSVGIISLDVKSGVYGLNFNPNMQDPLPEVPNPHSGGLTVTNYILIEGGSLGLYGLGDIDIPNAGKASVEAMDLYVNTSGKCIVGNHANVLLSDALVIGNVGSGELTISDAGTITSSWCEVGQQSGSTGSITITGAGSTLNANSLYIGRFGKGTLIIEAGGLVSNTDSYLGYDSGSTGAAMVTGAGSKWNHEWLS
jgi:T5SS/PEP-CTERM-associated repeat protein